MAQGTCAECGAEDRHLPGRSLCAGCYDRRWRAGTLDAFPRRPSGPPVDLTRTEKPCPICGLVKPLEDFARNNRRPDGRGSYCKPCAREKYHLPARQRHQETPPDHHGEHECAQCQRVLPGTEFYWDKTKGRLVNRCIACVAERGKARWDRTGRARQRTKMLERQYGLTDAEYDALSKTQGGVCAICRTMGPPVRNDTPRLAVDHCHTSGEVRGLLCANCNRGIGLFADSPERLAAAISYLSK